MKTLPVTSSVVLFVSVLLLGQLACGASAQAPAPPAATAPLSPPTVAPSSGEHGSAADAQTMLQAAVQYYQTAGRTQALADFTAKKPPFGDRDLYVVCMDSTHVETANGGFPQYVGTSADLLKDAHGNPLGKQIWDAVASQPAGSIQYDWIDPVTNSMEHKTLFYQKLDQDVCGVGIYGQ